MTFPAQNASECISMPPHALIYTVKHSYATTCIQIPFPPCCNFEELYLVGNEIVQMKFQHKHHVQNLASDPTETTAKKPRRKKTNIPIVIYFPIQLRFLRPTALGHRRRRSHGAREGEGGSPKRLYKALTDYTKPQERL